MQPMPGMRTRSRSRYYKVALRWRGKGDTRRLETFDRSTKDRAGEWIFFFNSLSLFFHFYLNDFSKELRETRNLYVDKSVDIRSKEIF